MKKLPILFISILTLTIMQSQVFAASSEVTWTEPEKYRDIRPGNENRKSFQDRIFSSFEKHFSQLAERLPEGQTLKIDVTNVDLAGDTHAAGINQTRIVKEMYPPRMNFSYQLVNADGSIAQAETVELKDMSFMMNRALKYRNTSIGSEKKMLDDWFFETFKDVLVEKK